MEAWRRGGASAAGRRRDSVGRRKQAATRHATRPAPAGAATDTHPEAGRELARLQAQLQVPAGAAAVGAAAAAEQLAVGRRPLRVQRPIREHVRGAHAHPPALQPLGDHPAQRFERPPRERRVLLQADDLAAARAHDLPQARDEVAAAAADVEDAGAVLAGEGGGEEVEHLEVHVWRTVCSFHFFSYVGRRVGTEKGKVREGQQRVKTGRLSSRCTCFCI